MPQTNPYLDTLIEISDDEIFEIISNPAEADNSLKYEAAIGIATQRELITEYQAKHLMEGNIAVLEYNPENIDNQELEEEAKESHKKSKEKSNIRYGLSLMGGGAFLLWCLYLGSSIFPSKTLIVGIISIFVGVVLLIIGLIERRQKRKKENSTNSNWTETFRT